jgi:hypothetical protein
MPIAACSVLGRSITQASLILIALTRTNSHVAAALLWSLLAPMRWGLTIATSMLLPKHFFHTPLPSIIRVAGRLTSFQEPTKWAAPHLDCCQLACRHPYLLALTVT